MKFCQLGQLAALGWIGFVLWTVVPADGSDTRVIDAAKQYRFAESYFQSGDYDRAVTEYDRFIHFFPQDQRVGQARFQSALAHHRNRDFTRAIQAFHRVIEDYPDSDIFVRSHFLVSSAYMELNDPNAARKTLQHLLEKAVDPELRQAAWYRLAWIEMETGNFVQAQQRLEPIRPGESQWLPIAELRADLAEAAALPRKNPTLAGVLSLIPGGGYAYCNRYQDALASLVVNGLLILAAVESFSDGNPALGGAISLVGSGFYLGNIYGGVNAAHKANNRLRQEAVNRIRDRYRVRALPSPDRTGWQIHVQIDF